MKWREFTKYVGYLRYRTTIIDVHGSKYVNGILFRLLIPVSTSTISTMDHFQDEKAKACQKEVGPSANKVSKACPMGP